MDPISIPDPRSARTPEQFVRRMTELRRWAGNPSLRMLRRLAGTTTTAAGDTVDALPESTTSYLLNGRSLPRPPRLEFVEAFVAACLDARHHPRDEIARETERWREAWRSLTAPADDEPFSEPVPKAARGPVPEAVPHAVREPVPEPAGAPLRRRLLVTTGAALLITAAGLLAYHRAGAETGSHSGVVTRDAAREVHRGTVAAMRDTDGLDLDLGLLTTQATRGIDITPWGLGNHLVTKSGATMVLLENLGPESYERCAAVPVERLVVTVRGLYGLAAPRNLCVWTREGRVAMLTLDETPSPRSGTLALHYVVWSPEGQSPRGLSKS
jgi:hypothetical protein